MATQLVRPTRNKYQVRVVRGVGVILRKPVLVKVPVPVSPRHSWCGTLVAPSDKKWKGSSVCLAHGGFCGLQPCSYFSYLLLDTVGVIADGDRLTRGIFSDAAVSGRLPSKGPARLTTCLGDWAEISFGWCLFLGRSGCFGMRFGGAERFTVTTGRIHARPHLHEPTRATRCCRTGLCSNSSIGPGWGCWSRLGDRF